VHVSLLFKHILYLSLPQGCWPISINCSDEDGYPSRNFVSEDMWFSDWLIKTTPKGISGKKRRKLNV
jgi:hypothetical protein